MKKKLLNVGQFMSDSKYFSRILNYLSVYLKNVSAFVFHENYPYDNNVLKLWDNETVCEVYSKF